MTINKKPIVLLLTSLLLLTFPSLLWAASVELSWQPNTEPDLQGYNVYYGTQQRNYGPPVPVADTTRHTLSGLEEGGVYYIALSAVDTSGNESGFSNEISVKVSSNIPSNGLPVVAVTSSGDDGNAAANTIDNDLSSRWSASGSGQWIQYDLGAAFDLDHASIAFYRGDTRTADFEVLVSQDTNDWSSVFKGRSSGATSQQEDYALTNATGRYVRIVGYGNSANDWNSITEVDIDGVVSSMPDTPEVLPAVGVTSSEDDGNAAVRTMDNDLSTRWSAKGNGQWVQYDLGAVYNISEIAIAYYRGDARTADFEVFVSQNATEWSSVYKGQSSGSTLEEESYPISDIKGRHLRIVGYGNSSNDWNSITEVDIVGSAH